MEKVILSIIHEYSLDNNDFYDKENYELEINNLKRWLKTENPVNTNWKKQQGWKGFTNIFDMDTKELIHYEP